MHRQSTMGRPIYIVDDEPEILRLLTEYLTMIGHLVKSAPNGEEGWLIFSSFQPAFDLVITDVRMPKMDGLQLLEKIRGRGIDTPVVVIAGHSDSEIAKAAKKFGILKILAKPFSFDDVDEVLALVSP